MHTFFYAPVECVVSDVHLVDDVVGQLEIVVPVRRHAQLKATARQNSGAHLVRTERARHDHADGQRNVILQHVHKIFSTDFGS